jgi:hypothetical protein
LDVLNDISMIFLFVILSIILSVTLYLIADYIGPKRIRLKSSKAFSIDCKRAKDLIVQEFDSEGNLWATRGFIIFCLKKGENEFVRTTRIPSGFSIFWFNNFRIFRKFTLRSEIVEMTINEDRQITAFASGLIWFSAGVGQKFEKLMELNHFGPHIGRGIMSTGILQANKKELYLGEYFSNKERTNVKVFKLDTENRTCKISYEFKPGQIRHIHALQRDPYTNRLWICVGDEDNESMIGWSDDNYRSITPVGQGSQIWRTCQLVFTDEAIFWGTDTGSKDLAGIYRLDRKTMELKKVQRTQGAIFFSIKLNNGTIVMSTDREGFPNEEDDKTRIFLLSKNNEIITFRCGTWDYKKHGFRFNFAKLRLQRSNGDSSLAMSVLNQKEFPESELLIFSEENLV